MQAQTPMSIGIDAVILTIIGFIIIAGIIVYLNHNSKKKHSM